MEFGNDSGQPLIAERNQYPSTHDRLDPVVSDAIGERAFQRQGNRDIAKNSHAVSRF